MSEVPEASLAGKLESLGPLEFTRVQWWDEAPGMVLLRYRMDGKREEPLGIRMDLDKRAVLDSVANSFVDNMIQRERVHIWEVVERERRQTLSATP